MLGVGLDVDELDAVLILGVYFQVQGSLCRAASLTLF